MISVDTDASAAGEGVNGRGGKNLRGEEVFDMVARKEERKEVAASKEPDRRYLFLSEKLCISDE